jgi:crossover junction endodeoxyribonuclease RuvC
VIILGVDPGLTRCGYGLINAKTQAAIDFGLLTSAAGTDPRDRVGSIAKSLEDIVAKAKPDVIALERVFAQANLRSVMGVAQVSGALMHIAYKHSIPLQFFTPSEVKAAVTGNGRATKEQVSMMVKRLLKLDELKGPADIADALAVALTASKRGGSAGTDAQQKWVAAAKAANRRIG